MCSRRAALLEPSSSRGDAGCGRLKLALSVDLETWDTCSPDDSNTRSIGPGAPYLAAGANGALLMAFANFNVADTDDTDALDPGVWIWVDH